MENELLILFSLAVIANQLTWQHELLHTPREWIASKMPDWIAKGMACPVCVGWWVGLVAAVVASPDTLTYWYWPFVVSGLSYLYVNLGD